MSRRFPASFLTGSRIGGIDVDGDGDAPRVASLHPEGRPVAVYRPNGYERNYAYPLVLWFHAAGDDERSLHRVMPLVSDRNAVGLAVRGERLASGGGFDWSAARVDRRARLRATAGTLRNLRRDCHVHTERIVVAGAGSGATAAANLFFARPGWFGGLALFGPTTEGFPAAAAAPKLADKPALVALPAAADRSQDLSGRLGAAGLSVTVRRDDGVTPESLRHLNRWLLATVCGAI